MLIRCFILGIIFTSISSLKSPDSNGALKSSPVYFPALPDSFQDYLRSLQDLPRGRSASHRAGKDVPTVTSPKPTTTTEKLPLAQESHVQDQNFVTEAPGPSYLTDSLYYNGDPTEDPLSYSQFNGPVSSYRGNSREREEEPLGIYLQSVSSYEVPTFGERVPTDLFSNNPASIHFIPTEEATPNSETVVNLPIDDDPSSIEREISETVPIVRYRRPQASFRGFDPPQGRAPVSLFPQSYISPQTETNVPSPKLPQSFSSDLSPHSLYIAPLNVPQGKPVDQRPQEPNIGLIYEAPQPVARPPRPPTPNNGYNPPIERPLPPSNNRYRPSSVERVRSPQNNVYRPPNNIPPPNNNRYSPPNEPPPPPQNAYNPPNAQPHPPPPSPSSPAYTSQSSRAQSYEAPQRSPSNRQRQNSVVLRPAYNPISSYNSNSERKSTSESTNPFRSRISKPAIQRPQSKPAQKPTESYSPVPPPPKQYSQPRKKVVKIARRKHKQRPNKRVYGARKTSSSNAYQPPSDNKRVRPYDNSRRQGKFFARKPQESSPTSRYKPADESPGKTQDAAPVYHTSTKSYRAPSSLFEIRGPPNKQAVTVPSQPDFIKADPNIYVPQEYDEDAIPGQPGIDYPVYHKVPETSFKCENQEHPGLYADKEANCQVFHICQEGGREDSFLCPNGTVFNQQYFVCDWWYNFSCDQVERFYSLNALIYEIPETEEKRYSSIK